MNSRPRERRDEILRLIRSRGTVSIPEVASAFDVSEMTVRRTLHALSDKGLVVRTPGGAMALPGGSAEKSFLDRSQRMAAEKDAIGRAAAALVSPGQALVLDSGTTTRYIARHLLSATEITVITTSLAVVEELAGNDGVRVELTGGVYRRASHDLTGSRVADSLDSVHADKVFFGADALSFRKGVMNYDSAMPRAFLSAGRERVLVLDSSKIGVEAIYRFCPLDGFDLLITDAGAKPRDLARLRKLTRVLVAE